MSDKAIPVRVAVRIRPLVPKEITEGSQHFITKVPNQPQVTIKGSNEAFTYDYVFGPDESQSQVYDTAVTKIVGKIFKGYNVTILAYGQTGSGKTFSMGTADMVSTTSAVLTDNSGIIQRAVKDLFQKMGEDASLTFDINVSFLELYMEKVYDLLSKSRNEEVDIREDPKNGIKINGLTETPVSTWEETLKCLENGSLNRRTGATAMNHQSSRSHAIFTLTINQINKDSSSIVKTSKFHLVDLAGSERASKTHAVGERFAEGVNINKGLLSLGNVISALCESNPRHIPYRDSKLTRLLQDSLGGNSHTLMIACVSPADSNYEETLSTLRYADRARKIKNKPIVNQDPTIVEVMALRAQVQQLLAANNNGSTSFAEVEQLRQQLKFAEEEKIHLTRALQLALEENTNMCEKALLADAANMQMKQRLEELQMQAVNLDRTLGAMNQTFNDTGDLSIPKAIEQMLNLKSKIDEIQDVQRKGEIEQVNHDMQSCIGSDKENKDSDSESTGSPRRLSKLGADMALRQAALSNDLKELNAQLALKVHMVNKMTQDQEGPYSTVKAHYDATVSELENQIAALQQEKEELASLLAQVSGNVNACKISEQRRKRLQELEPQINELKKKIQEQANIIKLKQRTEEQLKKFNNDIQAMRAQKVKLVRQMREENEKFRTWRQQKDREVARLKDQDRKRQGQLQKMEVLHAKQQNVLRRKMEDAMAVTKRLKEALSLQSTKPNKSSSTSTTSENDQRIKTWLLGELNLLVKTKEAELALESLKESRRTLATRQSKLETKLASLDQNDAFLHALKSEIANVAADIDLRSEQINELNQKIAAADLENKAKTRLDYLQTMIEAKVALKILLEESVAARVENFSLSSEVEDLRSELEDLQRQQDEALHEISNYNQENVQMKQKHQSEISKISRDYEERMLTLIRQLPPVGLKESADHKISEKDIMERLRIQQEELERCSTLQEQLHSALNEIETLKQQKPALLEMRAPLFPSKPKKPKATQRKPSPVSVDVDDVEDIDDYNSDDDPEWRNTPMARRIRKLKEEDEIPPKMFDLEKHAKKVAKRLSRSRCSCSTGGCRSCICSRDNRACTIDCGCRASGVCKNVDTDNVLKEDQNRSQQHEEQNRMLNETFDLGRKRSQPSSKENSRNGEDVENDLSGTQPLKKSRIGLSKLTKKGGFFDSNA
ncbi:chromosome-associated kinesin KIF4-like [Daphnia carinata]|uniref:chromosome-associated kinesin KIF4-like n=1 Tax=Daphnia carinata TaxID=120202 RepID=UPI0025800EF1|nr:chromosome-associated kinesin KIF4-like [Daphnia carinata]